MADINRRIDLGDGHFTDSSPLRQIIVRCIECQTQTTFPCSQQEWDRDIANPNSQLTPDGIINGYCEQHTWNSTKEED
jgi:hypothetical protein